MTHHDRHPTDGGGVDMTEEEVAARLIALKLEALERDVDGKWSMLIEREGDIMLDAARGLARRCVRRAALADAVEWEDVATAATVGDAVGQVDTSDEAAITDHVRAIAELAVPTAVNSVDDDSVWHCGHIHDQLPGC